ncbi:MAG TPA: hypothetical protein VE129_18345 [Thermoanaerobaculia bacterium]|nr:hypothetical protein [Thermoanaerobaculia bacterium]
MRKQVIAQEARGERLAEGTFLDLETLARVEITSEDPAHTIESALGPGNGDGWRAAGSGPQRVRVVFDEPQRIRRVRVVFEETHAERTQEFALSWIPAGEKAGQFLVRQQYTFSPGGATREVEEYTFDLQGVAALELEITPDISKGAAIASLVSLQVA